MDKQEIKNFYKAKKKEFLLGYLILIPVFLSYPFYDENNPDLTGFLSFVIKAPLIWIWFKLVKKVVMEYTGKRVKEALDNNPGGVARFSLKMFFGIYGVFVIERIFAINIVQTWWIENLMKVVMWVCFFMIGYCGWMKYVEKYSLWIKVLFVCLSLVFLVFTFFLFAVVEWEDFFIFNLLG